jgi:hypothetical protein
LKRTQVEKVDFDEMRKSIEKLPEQERLKIHYMIKGMELMNDSPKNQPPAA